MKPATINPLFNWGIPYFALLLAIMLLVSDQNAVLFLLINRCSEITGSAIWSILTLMGDEWFALSIAFALVVRFRQLMPLALLAILNTYGIVHSLKPLVNYPRPPAILDPEHINIIGKAYTMGSFPSGHTSTAMTLVAILLLSFRKMNNAPRACILALGLLVGFSRSVVGVHWPVDILTGIACGWLSVLLAQRLTEDIEFGNRVYYPLLTAFLLCTLYALFVHTPNYPYARIFFASTATLSLIYSGLVLWQRKVAHG